MRLFKGTTCFCESQPWIDPDTNACPACGATLLEIARWNAEASKGAAKEWGVKPDHLELVPKDHVEPF